MQEQKTDVSLLRKNQLVPARRIKRNNHYLRPAPDKAERRTTNAGAFYIVGIGASAGGLEALEQFLRQVPQGSGMAFVIVQHLDPTHKGIMPELLQRATAMEVFQVRDRMRVKPNCVYVIPPIGDVHSARCAAPVRADGAPWPASPYDFSSAPWPRTKGAHIGVILSGMGSDGTMGLRAIKEKAGVALVQEPASAKFDSMPRSAIEAGLADLVAPAEDLPVRIVDYLRHARVISRSERPLEEKDQSSLEKILILLRTKTGQDFSLYKKNTVYRRVERRMSIHQIDRIASYFRYLQENSQELELLFKELLIGVTSFFRDPAAWEQLKGEAIPALLAGRPAGGMLRPGQQAARPGKRRIRWPLPSRRRWSRSSLRKNLCCRSLQPTWTRTRSTRPARGSIRPTLPRTFLPSACAGFYQGRERLPGQQGDPGDGDLCHSERHHGSPFYQAGDPHLPQPFDISDAGTAKKAHAALSLQPEPRRYPVLGSAETVNTSARVLCAAGPQVETLPSARISPVPEQ